MPKPKYEPKQNYTSTERNSFLITSNPFPTSTSKSSSFPIPCFNFGEPVITPEIKSKESPLKTYRSRFAVAKERNSSLQWQEQEKTAEKLLKSPKTSQFYLPAPMLAQFCVRSILLPCELKRFLIQALKPI